MGSKLSVNAWSIKRSQPGSISYPQRYPDGFCDVLAPAEAPWCQIGIESIAVLTHLARGSLALARAQRGEGRVPAHRHRPKSQPTGSLVPTEVDGGDTGSRLAKVSAKIGSKTSAIKPNRKTSQRSASIRTRSRLAGTEFFEQNRSTSPVRGLRHNSRCQIVILRSDHLTASLFLKKTEGRRRTKAYVDWPRPGRESAPRTTFRDAGQRSARVSKMSGITLEPCP